MNIKKFIKILFLCFLCIFSFSGCDKDDKEKIESEDTEYYYACKTVKDYSDVIPTSFSSSKDNEGIVLNGYLKQSSSELVIQSLSDSSKKIFEKQYDDKEVLNILFSEKYKNNIFILYTDGNIYNVVDFDFVSNTEKIIYTSDFPVYTDINIDYNGNVIISVIKESDAHYKLIELIEYSPGSGDSFSVDISKTEEFNDSNLDIMFSSYSDFKGSIWCFYNADTSVISFVKYDSELKKEYSIESNGDEYYLYDNCAGCCISNKGDLLINRIVGENELYVDKYDIETGKYKNVIVVSDIELHGIMDGKGDYLFLYLNSDGIGGVSEMGETVQLCNTEYTVSSISEIDNELIYTGYQKKNRTDVTYLLDNQLNLIKQNKPEYDNQFEYYCSLCGSGNEIYNLYRNNDDKYVIKNSSGNVQPCEFQESGYYLNYLAINDDIVCGVFIDASYNYKADILDLKNNTRNVFELDSFEGNTGFYYNNDCLYILNENYQTGTTTDIFRYQFDSENMEKILSLDNASISFTMSSGQYDFCYISNNEIYAYEDNSSKLLFEWNKIQSIPSVLEIFVNEDHSYNIVGSNTENKLTMYNFYKTDNPQKEEKTVLSAWVNMDISDILPGTPNQKLKKQIDAINDSSEDYIIELEYHSFEELSKKILTDDGPDLFFSKGNMDLSYSQYTVDLSELFGEDDLKNTYFSSIVNFGKRADKIYEVIPEYRLISFYGEKRNVGSDALWTADDLIKKSSDINCKGLFYGSLQTDMFYDLIYNNLNYYIDQNSNIISFKENNISKLLELIKNNTVPDSYQSDDSKYDEYFGKSYDKFKDDLCLLSYGNFDINLYSNLEEYVDIEDPVYVGVPIGDKPCVTVMPIYSVSILKTSDKQDMAKSVIKQIISEDSQAKIESFPLNRKAFESLTKENGMKNDEIEKLENIIDNYVILEFDNDDILDALYDSVMEYFNDKISSEDLQHIIENKVNLLLSETS